MDYFSELLDSYNKLKKRSFKLTYLSEAEGEKAKKKEKSDADQQAEHEAEAEKLAQEYADGATQIQDDQNTWDIVAGLPNLKTVDGAEIEFKIYQSKEKEGGAIVVWGKWKGSAQRKVQEPKGTILPVWEEFVAKLLGAAKGGDGPDGEVGGQELDALDVAEKRQDGLENQIGGAEEQLLIDKAAESEGVTPRKLEVDNPELITEIKLEAAERTGYVAAEAYENALVLVDKFCFKCSK